MPDMDYPQHDSLNVTARLVDARASVALAEAEENPRQPSDQACDASYEMAVALGWCRLTGVEPTGELNQTLPTNIAWVAACELCKRSVHWIDQVLSMGLRWDAAETPDEKHHILATLLQSRMDAWAALIAIEEACLVAITHASPHAQSLLDAEELAAARIEQFDDLLYQERSLLSAILDTNLIRNWRSAMNNLYRDNLPWWLDGTLERQATSAQHEAMRLIPCTSFAAIMHDENQDVIPNPTYPSMAWLAAPVPLRAAAAQSGQDYPALVNLLRWRSTDGEYEAVLGLSDQYAATSSLVVSFVHVQTDQLARELAGVNVQLAGIKGQIDTDGYAHFSHETVWTSGDATPSLRVGGHTWSAIDHK